MGFFGTLFRRNPKRRHCPVDWADLKPHKVTAFGPDVKAERCPKCGGIYLDNGEVVRLTGNVSLNNLLTKDLGLDSDSPHVCPGCGGVMDEEHAGQTRVDVCLTCKGVWVDHGELSALRTLSGKEARQRSPEKVEELARAKKARTANRKANRTAQLKADAEKLKGAVGRKKR